ncbi:hypothetical protein [Nocardia abscessus]|uniref:hypothetical protein n=1 Tax=Nocardia abscessus TaxID=120957 RepID=UPI0024584517|nr:hypothetical protein [Nocardia abscessus]
MDSPVVARAKNSSHAKIVLGDSHGVPQRSLDFVPDEPVCVTDLARREVNYRDGPDDGDGT